MEEEEITPPEEPVEPTEEPAKPAEEPAEPDDAPNIDDLAQLETDLEGMKTEPTATADLLREYAGADPRIAHALKSVLKGYKKTTETAAEERKRLTEERKAFDAERKKQQREIEAFQRALAESGFASLDVKAPMPTELADVDPSTLDARALLERAKAEAMNEIRKEFAPLIDNLKKPMQDFGTRARREQRAAQIRSFVDEHPDFTDLKPDIDKVFDANPTMTVEQAYWVAAGQRAHTARLADASKVKQRDLEALRSAQASGRGGGERGTLKIPARVRAAGAREINAWADEMRAAGWSEEQIRDAEVGN